MARRLNEIVKLFEEPGLIQSELDRRLEAARHTDPTKRREDGLRRDLARLQKSIERLLTAYQEDLLSLVELRHRMPELRRRERRPPPFTRPRAEDGVVLVVSNCVVDIGSRRSG